MILLLIFLGRAVGSVSKLDKLQNSDCSISNTTMV